MKLTNNASDFLKYLSSTTKIKFEDQGLKAEVRVCEPKNSKREFLMDYFYKMGELWVKYSTISSPFIKDLKEDFIKEHKIYGVC